MRENKIDLKRIIKASKRVVFLKYKNEVIAFIIALMVLLYIEFFPNYHLPSLLDNSICNKINNLIYQLLLAYVASFIFFFLNIYRKEIDKYKNCYPQIVSILNNLFYFFDSRENYLKSQYFVLQKENNFIYTDETLYKILNYLRSQDEIMKNIYGNTYDTNNSNTNVLCRINHLMAKQLFYHIGLLNHYRDVFPADYFILLDRISQNNYIQKIKDKEIFNIDYHKQFIDDEILLYHDINELRTYSKKMFGVKFR